MDIYVKRSSSELSQRKKEEYDKLCCILRDGRRNPVRFQEEYLGVKLTDAQKYAEMETWGKRFALWLCCRGWGKTANAAAYLMARMVLIPNSKWYVVTNSAAQSIEVFRKMEDLALKRIPSFKSVTDFFAEEIVRDGASDTGFNHNPLGHRVQLYNNSELQTLSTNLNAVRGKRGSVLFDETGWQSAEQMAATEHFADVDSSFGLSTEKVMHIDPPAMPEQLIYASSASDVTFPFYTKYVSFSRKMIMGDPDYFVADMNVDSVLYHSTVDGVPIKPHISPETVDKAVSEDPELAERELYNKFRKGAGQNAVVRAETIVRNSRSRLPLFGNPDGHTKFVFAYDPARNFDGSVLSIYRVVDDKDAGFKLMLERSISMVDRKAAKRTPLLMTTQLDIIRDLLVKYNGDRAAEWENIEFYIDAGAGGGGVSAVADQLLADWVGSDGQKHKGIVDGSHPQYETARRQYPNAAPIVHLLDPQKYKRIIYDALERLAKLDLIEYTAYDGKDFIVLDGEEEPHMLNEEERLALAENELLKNETVYMCRYDLPNGGVSYELAKEKRNKLKDDRASNVWAHAA